MHGRHMAAVACPSQESSDVRLLGRRAMGIEERAEGKPSSLSVPPVPCPSRHPSYDPKPGRMPWSSSVLGPMMRSA